jgi:tRNA (cytidine/uridine-2'-O-)-methyltransferase
VSDQPQAAKSQIILSQPSPVWGTAADTQLHIVLVSPEIPPNTGSIARLCAATGCHLHLVEPLSFALEDKHLRRAGLDYWPNVGLTVHRSFEEVERCFPPERLHLFSARATSSRYTDVRYQPGDALIFGRETKGLPPELTSRYPDRLRLIPIRPEGVRSLNLSNAASIALYEALRQLDFPNI